MGWIREVPIRPKTYFIFQNWGCFNVFTGKTPLSHPPSHTLSQTYRMLSQTYSRYGGSGLQLAPTCPPNSSTTSTNLKYTLFLGCLCIHLHGVIRCVPLCPHFAQFVTNSGQLVYKSPIFTCICQAFACRFSTKANNPPQRPIALFCLLFASL